MRNVVSFSLEILDFLLFQINLVVLLTYCLASQTLPRFLVPYFCFHSFCTFCTGRSDFFLPSTNQADSLKLDGRYGKRAGGSAGSEDTGAVVPCSLGWNS